MQTTKLAIPYAIFLGEDEIRDNQVTLKKMFAAEDDAEKQVTVSVEEAIARGSGRGLAVRRDAKCIRIPGVNLIFWY
ncbi:MAG: His/Gly/Thr/Pro-type tRNA ligase C-terminal domain-containing protein [Lachnospiraceae bacterium]